MGAVFLASGRPPGYVLARWTRTQYSESRYISLTKPRGSGFSAPKAIDRGLSLTGGNILNERRIYYYIICIHISFVTVPS